MSSVLIFFFSSRRRHTRSYGDWSSDVCSSDLDRARRAAGRARLLEKTLLSRVMTTSASTSARHVGQVEVRSEERRVGKECGARWGAEGGRKRWKLTRATGLDRRSTLSRSRERT